MKMEIVYSKSSLKFLKKQDADTQKRIIDAIEKIPAGDIKKLRGTDIFRLRVGDFRVLYDVNGVVVAIIDIGSRGQIYK